MRNYERLRVLEKKNKKAGMSAFYIRKKMEYSIVSEGGGGASAYKLLLLSRWNVSLCLSAKKRTSQSKLNFIDEVCPMFA